jgi:YggT family protein
MIALATFLKTIIEIFSTFIDVYIVVVIVGALISWVKPANDTPVLQIIYRLTEPLYAFMRRYIKTSFNGMDFAPIIVLLVLQFVDKFFLSLAYQFASELTRP